MGGVTTVSEVGKPYVPYSYLCGNDEQRRYQAVIDLYLFRELENMTGQHARIMPIAQRLVELFSEVITIDGAPLTDLVLNEAITEWSLRISSHGSTMAFRAFCKSILDSLPMAFNFRITAQKWNPPNQIILWNPLKEGLVSWMHNQKAVNLKVEQVENDTSLSKRELAFLLAGQIFEREDLIQFGFGDTYTQTTVGQITISRLEKTIAAAAAAAAAKGAEQS